MFESLLCTTIGEEVPAVVFQSVGAFQAGITAEQVGVNAGVFRSVPVDIGTQVEVTACLLYTSPSPRDGATSRMPSSA